MAAILKFKTAATDMNHFVPQSIIAEAPKMPLPVFLQSGCKNSLGSRSALRQQMTYLKSVSNLPESRKTAHSLAVRCYTLEGV